MTLSSWALVPVLAYLAVWAVNPLRARLAVARRLLPGPVTTHFAGDSLLQLILGGRHNDDVEADYDDGDDPRWEVDWHLLGPLVTTTAFNELPARFLQSLAPARRRKLVGFYDAGLAWAALGLALCVVMLLWEAAGTTTWLWSILSKGAASAGSQLALSPPGPANLRRSSTSPLVETSGHESVIKPLIPGVTLPWSHAPMLVAAFLLGQLVHEPGHAITGALSGLATLSASVHLSPIFPSASVRLPALALRSVSPREKARIAVAGCWHNLVFAVVVSAACAALGLTQRSVAAEGRVVLRVEQTSPLYNVLPVGAIITHLDDLALGAGQGDVLAQGDKWASYLGAGAHEIVSVGWCISKESFAAQSRDCCTRPLDPSASPPTLCFQPVNSLASDGRCLSPEILTTSAPSRSPADPFARSMSGRCPCSDEGDVCIDVDPREQVLRIGFVEQGQSDRKVSWLLWQGARQEVQQQVLTSPHLPPLFLPPFLYSAYLYLDALKSYVVMISFTLATLNLLPFPILDGGLSLSAFLEWTIPDAASAGAGRPSSPLEGAAEEGSTGDRGAARKRDRITMGAAWGVGGLGAWVLGGMGLRLILGGYG